MNSRAQSPLDASNVQLAAGVLVRPNPVGVNRAVAPSIRPKTGRQDGIRDEHQDGPANQSARYPQEGADWARDEINVEAATDASFQAILQPSPTMIQADTDAFSPLAQASSSVLSDLPARAVQNAGASLKDLNVSTPVLVGAGAVLVGLAAGGGGGGSSAPRNQTGVVQDGLVKDATVFIDVNKNGVLDTSEPSAKTDSKGTFTIASDASGPIVATGGINMDTGSANTIILKAQPGSTIVNPITTLVNALVVEQSLTLTAAETAVKSALGLDSKLNLSTYDPFAGTGDVAYQKVAASVALLASTVATAGSGGGAGSGSGLGAGTGIGIGTGTTATFSSGAGVAAGADAAARGIATGAGGSGGCGGSGGGSCATGVGSGTGSASKAGARLVATCIRSAGAGGGASRGGGACAAGAAGGAGAGTDASTGTVMVRVSMGRVISEGGGSDSLIGPMSAAISPRVHQCASTTSARVHSATSHFCPPGGGPGRADSAAGDEAASAIGPAHCAWIKVSHIVADKNMCCIIGVG